MNDKTPRKGITRRTAVGGMLGTAALAATVPGIARTPGRKPNFLFIMADDFGWADLSCYGRQEYQTPGDRQPRRAGHAVHAWLCQFRGLHRHPRGADHRALPVPLARRAGRAARRARHGACRRTYPPCPRCCASTAITPRWSASGTLAACRTSARSRAATTSSGAIAAAGSTTSPTRSPASSTCGTAT